MGPRVAAGEQPIPACPPGVLYHLGTSQRVWRPADDESSGPELAAPRGSASGSSAGGRAALRRTASAVEARQGKAVAGQRTSARVANSAASTDAGSPAWGRKHRGCVPTPAPPPHPARCPQEQDGADRRQEARGWAQEGQEGPVLHHRLRQAGRGQDHGHCLLREVPAGQDQGRRQDRWVPSALRPTCLLLSLLLSMLAAPRGAWHVAPRNGALPGLERSAESRLWAQQGELAGADSQCKLASSGAGGRTRWPPGAYTLATCTALQPDLAVFSLHASTAPPACSQPSVLQACWARTSRSCARRPRLW